MVKVTRNENEEHVYPAGVAIAESSGTLAVMDGEGRIIAMHQQWDFAFVEVPEPEE